MYFVVFILICVFFFVLKLSYGWGGTLLWRQWIQPEWWRVLLDACVWTSNQQGPLVSQKKGLVILNKNWMVYVTTNSDQTTAAEAVKKQHHQNAESYPNRMQCTSMGLCILHFPFLPLHMNGVNKYMVVHIKVSISTNMHRGSAIDCQGLIWS